METIDMLKIMAIGIFFLIMILVLIYWLLSRKKQMPNKTNSKEHFEGGNSVKKSDKVYTQVPVTEFFEFDKIEDNMIIQDKGQKYLMLIECDGINYDLMSKVEKTSVEAGFLQFLNLLRYPIQLHIQTRTININKNIEGYTNKIKQIKKQLEDKQKEYNEILQNHGEYKDKIKELKFELLRLQNLYDYGKDIIANIEKMNCNRNVLQQYYYVVVPCYISETTHEEMNEEEKRNIMFSELYTRAQGIVRALSACSVKSRILNSEQIAEVLYNAYNRDEAEVNTWDRILKSGYEELYSTAPDVLDKKMEALREEIQRKAEERALNTVNEIKSQKEKEIEKVENSLDKLVADICKNVIKQNEKYIGKEIAKKAIEKVDKEEEDRKNAKIKRKTSKVTK